MSQKALTTGGKMTSFHTERYEVIPVGLSIYGEQKCRTMTSVLIQLSLMSYMITLQEHVDCFDMDMLKQYISMCKHS